MCGALTRARCYKLWLIVFWMVKSMWKDVLGRIPLECQKPKQSPCFWAILRTEPCHRDFPAISTHTFSTLLGFTRRCSPFKFSTPHIIFMQFCRAVRSLDIPPLAGSMHPDWFLPPPRFLWHPWRWLCSISFRTNQFRCVQLDATHDDVEHFQLLVHSHLNLRNYNKDTNTHTHTLWRRWYQTKIWALSGKYDTHLFRS